jgi:hypothetical protein
MDELDTSPGVVRDTARFAPDDVVKHGVHPTGCTSRLGLTWSSAQTMRSWSTAPRTSLMHVIRCIYFNTSQIKSVYALLEETRSFSSS